MKRGDEILLKIEHLSGDGTTVARSDGMVFFVEDAVPGDTVRARIWRTRKNYAEARAIEVVSASSYRVEPRCKHFGVCGGCSWQQLAYQAQLDQKRRHIIDAFERIGGFVSPEVQPTLGCEQPYFYRNKMEYTFSNRQWLSRQEMEQGIPDGGGAALGLHVPERYDKVLNLEECWLQSELSAAIVRSVREIARDWKLSVYTTKTHEGYLRHLVIRDGKRTGEVMVNIVTTIERDDVMQRMTNLLVQRFPEITTVVNNITERKSMVARGDREVVYHGPGYITEVLGQYRFRISANSFFQTNTLQAEQLYNRVKELADLHRDDVVYDLYSGTGTIAIYLSDAVKRVVGIEVVESATADAQQNAELNDIGNCTFLQGDLAERLTKQNSWLAAHPPPTVIVVDPPRSGMHPTVVAQIVTLSPRRILYVSCNPATQARDAKMLAEAGYKLETIQPVDMFPHTDHIESIARFAR